MLKSVNYFIRSKWQYMFFAIISGFSLAAFTVVSITKTLFIYDDSASYLNIPRLAVDNIQPGIEQIGSVWLPLNHLLKLPTIWIDFAYRTGISGSIISMISYIVSCVFVYKLVAVVTKKKLHAVAGTLVFALNPALLYLQSTAMSELLFMATFMASAYYFVKYSEARDVKWLLVLGLVNAAMLWTRYEGWFVVALQALLVLWWQAKPKDTTFYETVGRLFILLLPSFCAALAWFVWNYHVAGDPLYFLRGELSASAFTQRQQTSGVRAQGDIVTSLFLFGSAAVALIGIPGVFVATGGFLRWMWQRYKVSTRKLAAVAGVISMRRASVTILLLSPAIFHITSLFLGFSSMKVAGIGGDTVSLNLRYSIFLLPYIAVGSALLFKKSSLTVLAAIVVIGSYGFMFTSGLAIIDDALEGKIEHEQAAIILENNVNDGERVLVSMATNSPLTFYSNLDLDYFVHEGSFHEWNAAIEEPTTVDWVVGSNRFEFDSIAQMTVADEEWLADFIVFYENDDIIIYRAKQ